MACGLQKTRVVFWVSYQMNLRLDRTTAYALCAMGCLMRNAGSASPLSADQIAARGELPPALARKILGRLVAAGLVRGTRGQGYELADRARSLNVLDVLEAMHEAPRAEPGCFVHEKGEGPCRGRLDCAMHALRARIEAALRVGLAAIPLTTLPEGQGGAPPCFQTARAGAPS